MNKIYVSSLLIALFMAGTQSIRAQESDLDALMAEMDAPEQAGAGQAAADQSVAGADQSVQTNSSEAPSQDDLYSRGVEAYRAGDYKQAMTLFEAMLAKDPYDMRAVKYLRMTSDKSEAKAYRRKEAVREKSMVDIKKGWTPDFSGTLAAVSQPPKKPKTKDEIEIDAMTQHLKNVMIPTLDFRDANIKDVILFLSETCRRLDEPTHDGINFVLLGLEQSDKMGASDGNNITISVRDMSLYDSLQAIVEMANLKFEVQPESVLVMPVNYVRSVDLVQKSFEVISEVGDELASMAGGDDSSGGGMDDLFGESTTVAAPSGPVDVSGYFSYVQWPKRASAFYYPAFHKLIVKNTSENIDKVKKIIDTLTDKKISERSNQVEIETKFVEFSDGAYDELGFNWNVYGTGSLLGGLQMLPNSTYTPDISYSGSASVFTEPTAGYYTRVSPDGSGRPGQALFSAGQRSGSQVYEASTSGILSSMGGVAPSMLFSNGDVDMKINAMQQEGTADILSSPRVTTQSGNEAVIRVVEIHRYPQDYDVETGQRTAPIVKPQDWEDFDLGVVLRVTPDVDPEKGTVLLQLDPEIKKFKGFEDYAVAVNAYAAEYVGPGGTTSTQIYGDGSQLFARMPYFETRSVSTRVVVMDGHTVVMGGLLDERSETFRDQVPFLGDIPYVGRLFRTEGSRTVKKNLVICVKATQVDEHGMTRADRAMARNVADR